MMTTGGNDPRSNVQTIYGLSTDAKPTDGIGNGWAFVEMNTGKLYFYNEDGTAWIEWGA